MSTLANIDPTSIVGRSGGGPQVTLKTKIAATPDLKTLTFESLPGRITWGQVARINIPGGAVLTRANYFSVWKSVLLRFDCGLGQIVGDVTGIRMNVLGFLHAIESISILADQQVIHTVDGGSRGLIAQKYLDSILKRMPEDIHNGRSAAEYIYNLCRAGADSGPGVFTAYDESFDGALCNITDRGIDLSMLFDGLFTECDPRIFGGELIVEIVMEIGRAHV